MTHSYFWTELSTPLNQVWLTPQMMDIEETQLSKPDFYRNSDFQNSQKLDPWKIPAEKISGQNMLAFQTYFGARNWPMVHDKSKIKYNLLDVVKTIYQSSDFYVQNKWLTLPCPSHLNCHIYTIHGLWLPPIYSPTKSSSVVNQQFSTTFFEWHQFKA
jgi:hypothetical protein